MVVAILQVCLFSVIIPFLTIREPAIKCSMLNEQSFKGHMAYLCMKKYISVLTQISQNLPRSRGYSMLCSKSKTVYPKTDISALDQQVFQSHYRMYVKCIIISALVYHMMHIKHANFSLIFQQKITINFKTDENLQADDDAAWIAIILQIYSF